MCVMTLSNGIFFPCRATTETRVYNRKTSHFFFHKYFKFLTIFIIVFDHYSLFFVTFFRRLRINKKIYIFFNVKLHFELFSMK